MEDFFFERLRVYQEARCIVKDVYALLRKYPDEEKFALTNQTRRAVISVTSNIAEGVSRTSIKEKQYFLDIAFGSLMETYSQLQLAVDLNYITMHDMETIKPKMHCLSKMLLAFKNSLDKK